MKIRIVVLRIILRVLFRGKSILLLKNGKIEGNKIICDELLLLDNNVISDIYAPKSCLINLNKEKTELISCDVLSDI